MGAHPKNTLCTGANAVKKTKVLVGLVSTEGDRLGHLVRGVQMLRSYGKEFDVTRYSKVINVPTRADQPPALCALLTGDSEASLHRWRAMVRETQWALGNAEGGDTLQVTLLRYGDQIAEFIPKPLQAVLEQGLGGGNSIYLPASEFRGICAWGQQLTDTDAPVIGEWPSATGP